MLRDPATDARNDAFGRHSNRHSHADSLPEQIPFFDIQFDFRLGEYVIQAYQHNVPAWPDLQPTAALVIDSQVFRCGDRVLIEVLGEREANIAQINEVKRLPGPDKRKLVLITWLYHYRGLYYHSNHLQIVLSDTIAGRATRQQMRDIQQRQLYDACGRRKICDKRQRRLWQQRKRRITENMNSC